MTQQAPHPEEGGYFAGRVRQGWVVVVLSGWELGATFGRKRRGGKKVLCIRRVDLFRGLVRKNFRRKCRTTCKGP